MTMLHLSRQIHHIGCSLKLGLSLSKIKKTQSTQMDHYELARVATVLVANLVLTIKILY